MSRIRTQCAKILVMLVTCTFATGCWDATEIDQLAIVTVSGVDVVDKTTTPPLLRGSGQIALPSALGTTQGGGGSSAGSKDTYIVEEGEGRDPVSILEDARKKISRKMIMSHRQAVILGEDFARLGLSNLLDEIVRNPQSRLRTDILVAYHEEAETILKLPHSLDRLPSNAIEGLQKQVGLSNFSIRDFLIALSGKGDPYAMGIESIKTTMEKQPYTFTLRHIAVFQKDKLVGWLSGKQVDGFVWLLGKMRAKLNSVPIDGQSGTVGVMMLKEKTTPRVQVVGGKPQIGVKVEVEDDINENNTSLDLNDPRSIALVESAIKKQIEGDMKSCLDTLQHQYQADCVGYGELIYEKYPTDWHRMEKNWRKEFSQLHVPIDVHVRVRRSGLSGRAIGRG